MRISQIIEARNANARTARNFMDSRAGGPWTDADRRTYDNHLSVLDRLDAQIADSERSRDVSDDARISDALDTAFRKRRGPTDEIFDTFVRRGEKGFTDEQRKIFFNTLSTTTPSEGGNTVPAAVASELFDVQKWFSPMRAVCRNIITDSGANLSYPSSDGTAESGEVIAQNTTATALDPSFGSVLMNTAKISSKLIIISLELLQDSSIDVVAFFRERFGSRTGRTVNNLCTLAAGTGSAGPEGVVTAASSGKVGIAGETLTLIADDIFDLYFSLDAAYRINATWMASDALIKVIRKLKDSAGQPIFMWGDGANVPPSLLGRPLVVNNDMAAPGVSVKSLLFGDFSKYLIRDALDVQMFRFSDSALNKLGQVGFLAWSRVGGNLIDANAIRYFQHSAT